MIGKTVNIFERIGYEYGILSLEMYSGKSLQHYLKAKLF